MFSSHSTKFFAGFALLFLLFSACRRAPGGAADSSSALPAETLKSEIPFPAKEPEIFQTELVVTAGESTRRTLIARRGPNRRYDYDAGTPHQLTALQTDRDYLILPDRKIYAETGGEESSPATGDWQEFLTTEWLNAPSEAKFDKIETVEGLTRYRAETSGKNFSEILISVDEKLGLPVKQEFYSVSGAEKTLTLTVELKNLRLAAEDSLFVVPASFKKVSAEELRKVRRGIEAVTDAQEK